jgi:hypothetical protein
VLRLPVQLGVPGELDEGHVLLERGSVPIP